MLEPGDVGPHRPQPGCIVSVAYLLTATPCAPVPPESDGIPAATNNTTAVGISSAPASASPVKGLAAAATGNAPATDGTRLEVGDNGRRMLLEAQSAGRFEWGAGGVAPEMEALVDEIAGVGGTARCKARPGCAHAWARVLGSLAGNSYTSATIWAHPLSELQNGCFQNDLRTRQCRAQCVAQTIFDWYGLCRDEDYALTAGCLL